MKNNILKSIFCIFVGIWILGYVGAQEVLSMEYIPSITPTSMPTLTVTTIPTPTATPIRTATPTVAPTITVTPTIIPTPTPCQVTLLAVGDDLVHDSTLKGGLQEDGTYDFHSFYDPLREEIQEADIAVINQETMLGGEEFPYQGYPRFNTPDAMGDAIASAGFDVVLHATNHTMDVGAKAILHCLDFWNNAYPEITVLGIYDSKEQQEFIPIIEKNGIRIAMLNYTYGLNGIPIPEDKPYLVTVLTWSNRELIRSQIRQAKEQADLVMVFPHWGTEYSYEPDETQTFWTNLFAEENVDLVIGAHPHVLQPVEWVKRADGKEMLVFYSLGNFISGQIEAPRLLGGMAKLTLQKEEDGTVQVVEYGIVPVVTHYGEQVNDGAYATYRLSDYTQELLEVHGIHKRAEHTTFTLEDTWKLAREILGENLIE